MSTRSLALLEEIKNSDPLIYKALREFVRDLDSTHNTLTTLRRALDNKDDRFEHGHRMPHCRLRTSVSIGIPSGVPTALPGGLVPYTEIENTGAMYDANLLTRINIQEAGEYFIYGGCTWDVDETAGASYEMHVKLNGVTILCRDVSNVPGTAVTVGGATNLVSFAREFVKGDYLELFVYQMIDIFSRIVLAGNEYSAVFGAVMMERIPNIGESTNRESRRGLPSVAIGAL